MGCGWPPRFILMASNSLLPGTCPLTSSIIIFQPFGPWDLARGWLRLGPPPAQESLRTTVTPPPPFHDSLLLGSSRFPREKIGCLAISDNSSHRSLRGLHPKLCGTDHHGSHGVGGADAVCAGREGYASPRLRLRSGMSAAASAVPALSADAVGLSTPLPMSCLSPQSTNAGAVREAGGAFGKREQAEEERYFR